MSREAPPPFLRVRRRVRGRCAEAGDRRAAPLRGARSGVKGSQGGGEGPARGSVHATAPDAEGQPKRALFFHSFLHSFRLREPVATP